MAMVFERLSSSTLTLRGRVAEEIREAILNGTLREGEKIVERKLASQFGTSLAVIREAIIQLESEGFITKWPNASTHITKLSPVEIDKIFACREVFEGFAVEEASRLATPQNIESLEGLFLKVVDAARAQDSKSFIRKDLAFHEKIWEFTGNEYLQSALSRIIRPLFAFSTIRVAAQRSFDLLQDANLHLPLLNAIKSNDSQAARKAHQAALAEWRAMHLPLFNSIRPNDAPAARKALQEGPTERRAQARGLNGEDRRADSELPPT